MSDRFMKLGEALEIVHQLAENNQIDRRETDSELVKERERQQLALDTVHDFIVNHLDEDD